MMNKPIDRNTPILITGASGVLGQALLSYLQQEGFTDILSPSRNEMDLLCPRSVANYFEKYRPAIVVHLAAVVFGLGGNLKYQMRSLIDNTAINNHLFGALASYPVERIFFAGTVASYPVPYRHMPLVESDFFEGLPHSGEFGYAMAKRHAYAYLNLLTQEMGTRCTYGVFTNLYGAHDRFDIENGHVIPSLVAKAYDAALHDKPLDVWGNGAAERDFLHAHDAARAILCCLEKNDNNDLINISSATGISIREITEILAEIASVNEVRFDDTKPVGIVSRVIDNQRLLALGFQPSVSIKEGLMMTYQWYASNVESIRK